MTRRRLRTGASAFVLSLLAVPAFAQQPASPADEQSGEIDTLVPADKQAPAAPAKTGDPVLDRLNRLEAEVNALKQRNKELEEKLEFRTGRLEKVENRAAKAAQPGVAPTYGDTAGQFTFKVRGVAQADYAAFIEREGGYDYNNGTAFRRARLGFEGDAFRDFKWRLEVDFAGNAVSITDGYLQYAGIKPLVLTLGQHKAPFGLEANNSDSYNTFLERGMFTNAFGNVGAERRIGFSAAYVKDNFTFTAGLFGDNESISRSTAAPVTDAPDESWGVNSRITWEPVSDTGKVVHLGASGFWRTSLKSGDTQDAVRLSDRPNIRIDNGNIADSGVITGVNDLYYVGAEAAGVFGPFTLVGEYGKLFASRPGLPDADFDGFYVYGTWLLTGEARPFRNGNFDRLRPLKNFDKNGGWGAWELAVRYDKLDLSETPILARAGNEADSWTLGLNWYLNQNFKLLFNWIRFEGDNTPLDPIGSEAKGDALAARVHIDW